MSQLNQGNLHIPVTSHIGSNQNLFFWLFGKIEFGNLSALLDTRTYFFPFNCYFGACYPISILLSLSLSPVPGNH